MVKGFRVGDHIENRYRVLSILGWGGMGAVYRVADEAAGNEILALKIMTIDVSVPGVVEDFRREFQILTQLHYPHLVDVYEYGVTRRGDLYFTMEYVEGQDLKRAVQRRGPQSITPFIVQICRALAYIHSRGLVHGDLKPSNILVAGDHVRLVDFGLTSEARSTPLGYGAGTPGYVAPEVELLRSFDVRSDLYSLGAIWYELLVGDPPQFMADDHERLVHLMLSEAVGQTPHIPESIEPIVARLLALLAPERYPSANGVIEAVNQATGSTYRLETPETAASYALQGRLVGREAEMAALRSAWKRAQDEDGGLVCVVGGDGVGKTRLVQEFATQVELDGAWVMRGRCTEQGGSPYHPWREALRVVVRYVEGSDPACVEELAPVLATILPELWDRPLMAEREAPVSLGLRSEQLRLNESIAQLLRAAARLRPTVILLEDVHWADEATLELLDFLARIPNLHSLLVCFTYCIDGQDAQSPLATLNEERVTHIHLDTLSRQDTERLVCSMLGLEQLPASVIERVQHVTGGNVFFIQELIRSLAEDNLALERTTSGWRVDEEALLSTALPESIRQVVVRRLGRLLPTERELLEWAAVVGQVFWERTVMHIAPLPRERVQEGLRRLVERGLIIEHEPASFAGEREYVFENATLQHVAYERIPTALRPRCHLWVAEWLTGQDERRVEEYAELIASHYEQAGRVMKAADWYIRAGKHARSAFAPLAAIRYFRRALDYLPSLEDASAGEVAQQFTLYDGLVEVLRWQGRFAKALEAAQHMRAAAERMEDAKARARAHRDLALVYDRLGEYTVALEHADRAESIARAAGEVAQLELSYALAMKGWIYYRLGEAESALKAGHKALETCMALGARREVALSLNLLGALYDMLGNYEAAVRYGEASLEAFRELGDRHLVGSALNNLGENARLRGDYAAAVAYYEESLEVARQTGARSLEILTLNNLGGARVGLGRYEEAERDLRQVIEVEEGAGWFLSETYRFLARACLEQGKLEQALAAARQALERGLEGGNQEFTGAAWRSLGRVAARRGEDVCVDVEGEQCTYDAPACFAESLRIFEESGMEGERGRTLQAWADYELEQGDRARGEEMQREAQSLFERLGIVNG